MPTLYYKDPADGQYKPYMPGGLSQDNGDARYVKKAGDTMTGDLTLEQTEYAIHTMKARYPRFNMDNVAGDTGYAEFGFLRGGLPRWLIRTGNNTETGANAGTDLQFLARADDGASLGAAMTLNRKTSAVTIAGKAQALDANPFARYGASARAIPLSTWTQFTSIAISEQANGTFSGGTNMTVPDPGYYQVNMRILTSVAGRVVGSVASDDETLMSGTANWVFDDKAATAASMLSGSRIVHVNSYLQFWVYVTPASTCTLWADVVRVGR